MMFKEEAQGALFVLYLKAFENLSFQWALTKLLTEKKKEHIFNITCFCRALLATLRRSSSSPSSHLSFFHKTNRKK